MRFNLGKLTEDEEIELFRLSLSGEKRFTLEYYPKGYDSRDSWHICSIETLCSTNDYNEVVQKIQQHYQSLLANDASLIANDETVAYYQITDALNYNDEEVQIQLSELNRLSFMLQLCGYQPKKKTTKQATATKE